MTGLLYQRNIKIAQYRRNRMRKYSRSTNVQESSANRNTMYLLTVFYRCSSITVCTKVFVWNNNTVA